MSSSDSLSPTAAAGGAWSQSAEWGEDAAISLAGSTSLTPLERMSARWFAATSSSQAQETETDTEKGKKKGIELPEN